MRKKLRIAISVAFFAVTLSCTSHYQLTNIKHQRIVVNERFDAHPDEAATAFLAPYKQKVDSVVGPVMGMLAHDMAADRPESDLSNLLSDILIWASKNYNEQPVLGVYNIGGIRTALAKGKVTYGDILEIAPFENKIAFVTLKGHDLLRLFRQIASRGGEGLSHGVEMVITKDGKLLSVRLHGKEIDPQADYRIVSIDYVVQGNDGMTAFQAATNIVSPQEKSNNMRFVIMDYFKKKAEQGEAVSAKVEGRVIVKSEE